jgi:hypothetical protein
MGITLWTVHFINAKDGKSVVLVIVSVGMFFSVTTERFRLNCVFGDYTKSFKVSHLLGSDARWSARCLRTFQGNVLPYSSILKMEALCCSESSINIYRTTRRYSSEDSNICSRRCNNLESTLKMSDRFNFNLYSSDLGLTLMFTGPQEQFYRLSHDIS